MIVGLVLAGGQGKRLGGVRKSDLLLAGISLRQHLTNRLGEICDLVLVATGPNGLSSEHELPDNPADPGGPIAGFHALHRWLKDQDQTIESVLTAAVDAPGLPGSYARDLLDGLGQDGAAVAACDTVDHFTHTAWRPAALSRVLLQNPISPRAALSLAKARRVIFDKTAGQDPFRSINTVADLLYWQAHFTQQLPGRK